MRRRGAYFQTVHEQLAPRQLGSLVVDLRLQVHTGGPREGDAAARRGPALVRVDAHELADSLGQVFAFELSGLLFL